MPFWRRKALTWVTRKGRRSGERGIVVVFLAMCSLDSHHPRQFTRRPMLILVTVAIHASGNVLVVWCRQPNCVQLHIVAAGDDGRTSAPVVADARSAEAEDAD